MTYIHYTLYLMRAINGKFAPVYFRGQAFKVQKFANFRLGKSMIGLRLSLETSTNFAFLKHIQNPEFQIYAYKEQ
jgi:hypothetical protein